MPITVYTDTKIYVPCPAYLRTGGPELLHQLVHKLKLFGHDASIAYGNLRIEGNDNLRDPAYDIYLDNYVLLKDIVDHEKNILVIPETATTMPFKYKNIRKLMWFLSIDNYIECLNDYLKAINKQHLIGKTAELQFIETFNTMTELFATNSHRCAEYLKGMGVKEPEFLTEYINKTYFDIPENVVKHDIVAYNPKKGFEFTQRLIEKAQGLCFKPVENLDAEGVKALLLSSKVYIDFGNHPGKDRLPREAGACGCCVITGKCSSAAYFEDVPLPDEFKFDDNEENLGAIIDKIKLCFSHYDTEHAKLEHFRECVRNEEQRFENEIKRIFIKSDEHSVCTNL